MKADLMVLALTWLLASPWVPAQCPGTTGTVGLNDLTLNALGGGGGCPTQVALASGPGLVTFAVSATPGDQVIGALADSPACCSAIIDPAHSVDLSLATVAFWYNWPLGSGNGVPGLPFSSTAVNSAGQWLLSLSADLSPGSLAVQMGLVGPAFPLGLGTTQVLEINILPAICPGAVSITTLGGTLSDDGYFAYTLGASSGFSFYSQVYTTLFVNMNGSITFCTGDPDFTASGLEMVTDQPRIAPAWDDWTPSDPNQGDVKIFDDGQNGWCVLWENVRGFGCGGLGDSNTFAASGDYATGGISLHYRTMLLCFGFPNQVVGISPGGGPPGTGTLLCGGPAASGPNNVDLSSGPNAGGTAFTPIYEDFGQAQFGNFDLGPSWGGPSTLTFSPLGAPGAGPYTQF